MSPLEARHDVGGAEGTAVMEDDLRQLDQEFLGVAADAPVNEVIQQMKQARLGCALVLDDGKLVGIVSQRDLLLIESLPGVNPAEVPVEDAMTRDVFVVDSATPLAKVAAEMADRRRGSAVVMHDDRVVGVFTVTDACRVLARPLGPSRR